MSENINKVNPLGSAPIGKLLLAFALPSVVSMLVNAVYNIVDQIFIGQGVGYLGNAATTVAFPIVTIVLAVGTLLGAGGSAYAAIKLGEKNEKEAESTLGNNFFLLLTSGVVMMILGLLFLDPILKVFGATTSNMEYSRQYASVIMLGIPFNLVGIGLSNMARTDGAPKVAMYSMIAGALLNTILDPIYIFVFHWGVLGAAIATITSQMLTAIVLVHYFMKKGTMRLHMHNFKINKRICYKVIGLGVSSCIIQSAATIMQIIMNNSLVFYGNLSETGGDVALSGMGIVLKVSMIITSICVGIGIGAQPILGFNRGAKQPRRIKQTYIYAVCIASAVSIVGWILCLSMPQTILSIFGSSDQLFVEFSVKAMRIFMSGIFACGFQVVATSYFQATGQPVKASLLSALRQLLLLIPLIIVLPMIMQPGINGILIAGPISDIVSALIIAFFIVHEMKKLNREIVEVESLQSV